MTTVEPQYQCCLDVLTARPAASFGLMSNFAWHDDPIRLSFLFARYKFAARMLAGQKRVLEIGCGDGFASRIVRQSVQSLDAVDFDPLMIESAQQTMDPDWPINFSVCNVLEDDLLGGNYDASYCIDFLEHILPESEWVMLRRVTDALADHGVFLCGTPSLESQRYASQASKAGHVNCKTAQALRGAMERHFANVFTFSMNDEVVHTGYSGMSHYNWALCCGPLKAQPDERQSVGPYAVPGLGPKWRR